MPFAKILCPVDFSDEGRGAMQLAARLARDLGASLTIVHVVEPIYWSPPEGAWSVANVYEAVDKVATDSLRAARQEAEAVAPGVNVDTVKLAGPAWDRLVGLARSGGYDLVAMGTRGRTGLTHALLGSVAERVVRHAPCPVLVVRGERLPGAPIFHSLLCPIDFSEPSRHAMRLAVTLASRFGASLTLMHVYSHPTYLLPPTTLGKVMHEEMDEARRALAAWGDEARKLGAPDVRTIWAEGVAWYSVTQRAAEYGHDLIVTGTRGRSGIKHVLLGSVAERVIRHAPCPVLAVRELHESP